MSSKPQAKKAPAPKLRFPEFVGEWAYEPLFGLASLINKKAGTEAHTTMSITTGVGLVSQMEKFGREIAGAQYRNYFVIEKFDFAYNKSSTKEYPEGYIAMHTADYTGAVPNSIFTCFHVKRNRADPTYLNYLFQINLHGKWLRNFIAVGARANGALNVDSSDLLSLPVPVPTGKRSLDEQQKIAEFLSSLDAVIKAQTDKLTALRQHKTGLMQRLFPAEDESVPALRFPEFARTGAWEARFLGDFADFASGGTPSKNNSKYWGGKIPWISASSMYKTKLYKSELNITDSAVKDGARIAKRGTLLILVRGSMLFNRIPIGIATVDVSFNQDVKALLFDDNIDEHFMMYQLIAYESRIFIHETGIGAGKIETAELKKLPVFLPTLPEQRKVVNFLSSFDTLIDAQVKKVDKLKTFKRGLIQSLFPSRSAE